MTNSFRTFRLLRWLILVASASLYLLLAYHTPRQEFGQLIVGLAALFMGYGWLVFDYRFTATQKQQPDRLLFGGATLFRLLLLLSVPCLSDDVYRFVWDGRLLANGFNPYLYLPSRIIGTDVATNAGLNQTLLRQLNSPDYFTVYPPLNQAMFGLAAWLSGGSLLWNVIWLRIPILLSEAGTLYLMVKLLRRLGRNSNLALLYGLNPLVILELTGNLHFEAVLIFLVLLSIWWLVRDRFVASTGALALAIGTKLLPLLLLPLVVRGLGWRRGLLYAAITGGLTALLFAPFASLKLVQNVFSSINLYFQKFEFNASVYYVLRMIGYWIKGYNTIERVGAGLSVAATLGILWIAFRSDKAGRKGKGIEDTERGAEYIANRILATLTLYFVLATTVHPWYITSLVAGAVFTRFRYPMVWSALIPLSYFTYSTRPYQENLWLTAIEYGIVAAVAVWEIVAYIARLRSEST